MASASSDQDFQVPQLTAFSAALSDALARSSSSSSSSSTQNLSQATTNQTTDRSPQKDRATDLEPLFDELRTIFPSSTTATTSNDDRKARQYAIIEAAARARFDNAVAAWMVAQPALDEVWNLLDILCALSDREACDPALLFWLVEELLDSQTIEASQSTFDYLESRRERLTARHWDKKQLVVLRTCNELLRRLSRAEDIAFCGRVFIFMFQSFPLGDKSSVNLRGEYHSENVTTYELTPSTKPAGEETETGDDKMGDKMDVDPAPEPTAEAAKDDKDKNPKEKGSTAAKAVTFSKNKPDAKPLDSDTLYPLFWSLQQYFSQPLKLFEPGQLDKFKHGLEATVTAFEAVAKDQKTAKPADDNSKEASMKRLRADADTAGSGSGSGFNPKYLTSRDLFDLELSDLFFRRHIIIQAIIILDFLGSLGAKAKAKHAKLGQPNKSVLYADKVVAEEDEIWATQTRERLYEYILASPDGQYVHRIIQSVTQRDKGWAFWKSESCPPITKPPVSPQEFIDARASARRMATSKKLRPAPMGSLDVGFLKNDEDEDAAMAKFADEERWKAPALDRFERMIQGADLDLEMADGEKERAEIMERKVSSTWRALRVARRGRLAAFDKVEEWTDAAAVFKDPGGDEGGGGDDADGHADVDTDADMAMENGVDQGTDLVAAAA